MDTEQQVRYKFLEEAGDCFDRIEAILLGLGNTIPDPQALDQALRAAHSVKGGAAMMGFIPLSHVAHHLEDYFKILRVRHQARAIETQVETLLLQGVDCLRAVSDCHRQGVAVTEAWLASYAQPIFDQLHQRLGELRPEDEDALLAQEEDVDPALLMFEMGVESALDRLTTQLKTATPADTLPAFQATARELAEFGRIAHLPAFVQLCQSVQATMRAASPESQAEIGQQALQKWRKSLSLVALRRLDRLPSQLQADLDTATATELAIATLKSPELGFPEPEFPEPEFPEPEFPDIEPDLEALELAAAEMELAIATLKSPELEFPEPEFPDIEPDLEALGLAAAEMELAIANIEFPDIEFPENDNQFTFPQPDPSFADLSFPSLDANFFTALQDGVAAALSLDESLAQSLASLPSETSAAEPTVVQEPAPAETLQPSLSPLVVKPSDPPESAKTAAEPRQTVRVPVEQLQQFNAVFSQLILERNAINLRLEQLQTSSSLLKERMQRLEQSNRHLRQWYDLASLEGLIPAATLDSTGVSTTPVVAAPPGATRLEQFDSLELDRYGDLHVISQEQIETIVQLQEVTADIDLSLRDMSQSIRELNHTTRSLQRNAKRTQMVPFAEAIKRFPRAIRDLSLQFGKSVKLQTLGEQTLIDRAILDDLSHPLLHLIRNAFDHGIELAEVREAAGKPPEGKITLQASHRGGQTVITIQDDGGGIRLDRIQERLGKLGLPAEQIARMSESELMDFIFEPGFSTASTVTELSGRGVGMDVVRTNLQKLRGEIQVATQAGQGTTFTIRVPFTHSVLRVMLLERAGLVFAVAIDSVKEILQLNQYPITADGLHLIWNQRQVPLLRLEQGVAFSRPTKPLELAGTPKISQPTLLLAGEDSFLVSFWIDRFWGEQEVTLRPIDAPMPLLPGLTHAIILGDGRVVPLIDPLKLATWMLTPAHAATGGQRVNQVDQVDQVDQNISLSLQSSAQANTILVVDDSIHVRRYLALTLEKAGYQVEQARDGQEAVERLMGGLTVQAVICDIEMPRLDGYGLLENLRSQTQFASLPIAMLTSRSSDKHRKLAMNLGASAYFAKPYNEPELLQSLQDLIQAGQ